jgi:hypothetical protein
MLTGCARLEKLTWDITPEKWLASHPHLPVKIGSHEFILAEPSSTFLVYLLGFVILAAGIYFLKTRTGSTSRFLWGIALIIWSLSTFSAGTSYQAFSYEIKCAGRTACLWTSWWEIWYLILFVTAMNFITAAVAFSSANGKIRKNVLRYAVISTLIYLSIVLAGAFLPNYFLTSFECMVIFSMPAFVILFAVNAINHFQNRRRLDVLLLGAWVFMLLIVAAYFGFFISGMSSVLWAKGIWFNANDVLHILLIFWIIYLYSAVSKLVKDADEED